MPIEPEDSTNQISLLLEHSRGTVEVVMRLMAGRTDSSNIADYQPIEFRAVSGTGVLMLTHSALASALAMRKWAEQHSDIFSEGLTSFV